MEQRFSKIEKSISEVEKDLRIQIPDDNAKLASTYGDTNKNHLLGCHSWGLQHEYFYTKMSRSMISY